MTIQPIWFYFGESDPNSMIAFGINIPVPGERDWSNVCVKVQDEFRMTLRPKCFVVFFFTTDVSEL